MNPEGYILLARKIEDSDLWRTKPAVWTLAWLHILMNVHWKGKSRGEGHFVLSNVLDAIHGLTLDQWGRILSYLRTAKQITTRKTQTGILIKVLNYERYQDPAAYRREIPPTGGPTYSPEFLRFLERYPIKTHASEAWRAWASAMAKVSPDDLMAGVDRLVSAIRTGKITYAPRPDKYLRNARWTEHYGIHLPSKPTAPLSFDARRRALVERLWAVRDNQEEYARQVAKANEQDKELTTKALEVIRFMTEAYTGEPKPTSDQETEQ